MNPTIKDFSRYSLAAEHNGIQMHLVAHWIDLGAYYAGTDDNVWLWSASTGSWSNQGDAVEFLTNYGKRARGLLHDGLCPICGETVTLKQQATKDGRLIGSCGDAFTLTQWITDCKAP